MPHQLKCFTPHQIGPFWVKASSVQTKVPPLSCSALVYASPQEEHQTLKPI